MSSSAELFERAWQYHQVNLLSEAEQLYREGLHYDPRNVDGWCLLAEVYHTEGRLDDAVTCYQHALEIEPHRLDVINQLGNLGTQFGSAGNFGAAMICFQQVLRFKPDYAEAHNNLGMMLAAQNRHEEAIAHYRQAIQLRPQYANAYNNLGLALGTRGRYEEAKASFEQAIHMQPDFLGGHMNLGTLFLDYGRFDEAIACFHHVIECKPDFAQAYFNLGNAFRDRGCQAVRLLEDHVAPGSVVPHLADAIASYEQAIHLEPDYMDAHFNRGSALLLGGDYERGWAEYEWRFKRPGYGPRPFSAPRWDGNSLTGRTILLHAEQGLGDTIQFLRYAPLVKQHGGRVVVECQSALLPLAATCSGVDAVFPTGAPLPPFDIEAPLPSLPGILGTPVSTIPATIPYLAADPARTEYWRKELAAERRLKVGIVWRGSPHYKWDSSRSAPLKQFGPLADVPGVALLGLQVGAGSEELRTAGLPVTDLGSRFDPDSLADLAAVLINLDLLISVDTAPAHLAGSLGLPFWLALPVTPDWRWMLGRSDNPWYPTARLFRQRELGNWAAVFEEMAQALQAMQSRSPGQRQPRTPDAMEQLAQVYLEQGRLEEAVASYRQALEIQPDRLDLMNQLGTIGNLLAARGDLSAAITCFQEILRFNPHYAEAHNNLGMVLAGQGRLEEAIASYGQAARLKPDYALAYNNLGVALAGLRRFGDAVASYQHVIRLQPDFVEAYINLGGLWLEQGRPEEAIASFQNAILRKPENAEAHFGLGNALRDRWCQDLRPNAATGEIRYQAPMADALSSYEQAIRIDPDHVGAHFNRGSALLLGGDYERGWSEYEWRLRQPDRGPRPYMAPRWDGVPLRGRTILLYAEQGLGDTIQFLRYAPLVKQRGGRVLVECQSALLSLAATCAGIDVLLPAGASLPPFDVHAPLPSLPGIFGTSIATIPAAIPYLAADPARTEYWRKELAGRGGLKVGIVWHGSPDYIWNHARSAPLKQFRPLADVPGVVLFSLQVGAGREELKTAGLPVTDLPVSFADLAAVLMNLDLLVTVDTAPAHLAGALGLPFWLALPVTPHWPWMLGRSDSPWYPTARLFRQKEPGNWATVFEEMAQALRKKGDFRA